MGRNNYWIVKHDQASIEDRPGWIWRSVPSQKHRLPPHYKQISRGDLFALVSFPSGGAAGVHQMYGAYEVEKEFEYLPNVVLTSDYEYPNAFVIKGKLLPGLRQRWVTIPNLMSYCRKEYTGKSITMARSAARFNDLLQVFKKYSSLDIDFSPLRREPATEQEVVALFCQKLVKLGYSAITRLQTRFPDATVITPSGKKQYIEIEYYATGYDHPLEYKQEPVYCVCWIDDRSEKQKRRNEPYVVELRRALGE